jgi:hypothetical protein
MFLKRFNWKIKNCKTGLFSFWIYLRFDFLTRLSAWKDFKTFLITKKKKIFYFYDCQIWMSDVKLHLEGSVEIFSYFLSLSLSFSLIHTFSLFHTHSLSFTNSLSLSLSLPPSPSYLFFSNSCMMHWWTRIECERWHLASAIHSGLRKQNIRVSPPKLVSVCWLLSPYSDLRFLFHFLKI